MKTILIPTDFSSCSNKAVEFGIEIAKRSEARILLAYSFFMPVLDINVPPTMIESMYEAEEKTSSKKLQEITDRISSYKNLQDNPINCSYITEQNIPESEIQKLAEREKVDLIIMGSKGKEGFLGLWRSITAETAKNVHCPLLVVKENSKFMDFKNIDLAVGNLKEEILHIKETVKLASLFQSKVTLVHVERHAKSSEDLGRISDTAEDAENLLSSIKEYCEYSNIQYTTIMSDDTADGLLNYLKQTNADLLALIKLKRNWIENLFHKSVIKELIGESETPLLVLPGE